MTTLRISSAEDCSTKITVRESDQYSKNVYIKFDHSFGPAGFHRCSEMFMTPGELDLLGRFLIDRACEIQATQTQQNI